VTRSPPLQHSRLLLLLVALALTAALGLATSQWLDANAFPDGYQNEGLHVGNAFDLWGALVARDTWHLRHYVSNSYWPPLFYAATWPLLGMNGLRHDSLVFTNLGWLVLALVAIIGLARSRLGALLAMLAFCASPGLFGCLVRFEPNVANHALLAVALLALDRSEGLRRLGACWAFGLAAGLALLTDRLGGLPFLVLPVAWCLFVEGSTGAGGTWRGRLSALPWRGLLRAAIPVLVLAGPWYFMWFHTQAQEVAEQLTVGEIDSAGAHTEPLDAPALSRILYYPLVLLDSQAGLLLGACMLVALAFRPRALLLLSVLSAWLLFTFVAKKQVFYTLPVLLPLSVLLGDALARARGLGGPFAILLTTVGLQQFASRMWGLEGQLSTRLTAPDPLPAAWVSPRHLLARPPQPSPLPASEILLAMDELGARKPSGIVIFSDEPSIWEGYVELLLRERFPREDLRSVRLDPNGVYEWFRASTRFLCVTRAPDPGWPDATRIEAALVEDHYDPTRLPPVARTVADESPAWQATRAWPLPDGVMVRLWTRR
jgi:hypothetical protein